MGWRMSQTGALNNRHHLRKVHQGTILCTDSQNISPGALSVEHIRQLGLRLLQGELADS